MAAKHSIEIAGIVFPSDDWMLPLTLRRVFGHPLPRALRAERDESGAVPIRVAAREFRRLGREALRAFETHSVLVTPGTPEALEELPELPLEDAQDDL